MGEYGVGQIFFTENENERQKIEEKMNELIGQENQQLIGHELLRQIKKI